MEAAIKIPIKFNLKIKNRYLKFDYIFEKKYY